MTPYKKNKNPRSTVISNENIKNQLVTLDDEIQKVDQSARSLSQKLETEK